MTTVNVRASSIASIIDCPKRGLSIALGLVRQLPSTAPAVIGSACHAGTAAFDQARLENTPIKPVDAAEVALDYLADPGEEVNWGAMHPDEAVRRTLGVMTKYCTEIAPGITYESVEQLLDPLEVSFPDLDIVIELTGTLDRIYTRDAARGVVDVKTGARVCSTSPGKHKSQLAVYELLAERTNHQSMTLPAMIAQLQTSSEYQAAVVPVENSKLALLGDDEQVGLLEHIARMLKSGDFYGNSSSWLCSEAYCPLYHNCIFR